MPFTVLNGVELWYDDWGVIDGNAGGRSESNAARVTATTVEPIVFLHGFCAYRRNWGYEEDGTAWLLAHRRGDPSVSYRCIFLETRGCNESRLAPGPYTMEQHALDILALVDHLNISTFTFCGHSLGGGVGWKLAVMAQHRLRRLVLMAPTPTGGFPRFGETMRGPRTHMLQHYGWLPRYDPQDTEQLRELRDRYDILSEDRPGKDTPEWFDDRVRMISTVAEDYWSEAFLSMANLRLSEAVRSLSLPVLMIAGATDELLDFNVNDVKLVQNGVLHVFSNAGHETARDDPDGVARVIDDFVRGKTLSRKAHARLVEQRLRERGLKPVPKL